MNEYSEIVEKWKKLYDCYYYEWMPFFVIICHKFYKNKGKNITAEEMKEVILHYKNALNEYKEMLLAIDLKQAPHQKKYFTLRKKIQSEYERLIQIYDDLLNVEDMKNGRNRQLQ